MDVSFYNNGSSKKDQDLDCLETVAELALRILSHCDNSHQNNSEINTVLLSRKENCASDKTMFGFYLLFLCKQFSSSLLLPLLSSLNLRWT